MMVMMLMILGEKNSSQTHKKREALLQHIIARLFTTIVPVNENGSDALLADPLPEQRVKK